MNRATRELWVLRRNLQSGISLIELMVALVIGLFLIAGAVTIYSQSRATFRVTEAVARLQETARFAFDVMEPDIRMASYWGFHNQPTYIEGRAGFTQGVPATFAASEVDIDKCGNNWAVDLEQYVGGANGGTIGGYFPGATEGCEPFTGGVRAGADALVVRRASEAPFVTMQTNRIYVQTSRIQGQLFVPSCTDATNLSCIPTGFLPPLSRTHALEAHGYYVANNSTGRTGLPSLRRKRLVAGTGSAIADVQDEEIVPGVEDMQVQFGADSVAPFDGNVDAYFAPGTSPVTAAIVSVTVWLRVRAADPDFSYTDGETYQYAGAAAFDPKASASAVASVTCPGGGSSCFRRIVVSKTIQLRDVRT